MNGQVVRDQGCKVDPERDHIAVDGKGIPKEVERIYLALNKPAGYVTTREDPHATHVVMDLVRPALEARLGKDHPAINGLHPVGRLDTQTEGLLLLTNDGEFTFTVTHPRHQVPKVYRAEIRGSLTPEAREQLQTGVPLFGRRTLPARIRSLRFDRGRSITNLEIEIREGRNQQVRRMLQAVGYPVTRLQRVAIGRLELGRLRLGRFRLLTEAEVADLLRPGTAEFAPPPAPRRRTWSPGSRPKRPGGSGGRATGPSTGSRAGAADRVGRRPARGTGSR